LQEGEHVSDLLDYVHISGEELKAAYREKLAKVILANNSGKTTNKN